MRWRPLVVVVVLVMAGCGGGSESPAGTAGTIGSLSEASSESAEVVEAVVDELISVMGDDEVALAAVLLAGDLGYGVVQIVTAGVEGRLRPDGAVLDADGATVLPEYEPSRLLVDDVNGEVSAARGVRAPMRLPLTRLMEAWSRASGNARTSAVLMIGLFAYGYSFEQLVTAILAGDAIDGRATDGGWLLRDPLRLIDQNGDVIPPVRPERPFPLDEWDRYLPRRPSQVTSTTVTPTDNAAPDGTAPAGTTPDVTQPVDAAGGDRISGGSRFEITPDTAGVNTLSDSPGSGFCLGYSEPLECPGDGLNDDGEPVECLARLSLTACTDTPRFKTVHDLGAGTIAGSIDLELACPGADFRRCPDRGQAGGTVSGSFGPIVFGEQPQEAPDDWPFPAHHWYSSGSQDWWAGGPIELDVSIAGDYHILDDVYSADVTETITGWVESWLAPASLKPGELPTEWVVNFRVIIEYNDQVEPRWDFYVGYDAILAEDGIDIPPWRK